MNKAEFCWVGCVIVWPPVVLQYLRGPPGGAVAAPTGQSLDKYNTYLLYFNDRSPSRLISQRKRPSVVLVVVFKKGHSFCLGLAWQKWGPGRRAGCCVGGCWRNLVKETLHAHLEDNNILVHLGKAWMCRCINMTAVTYIQAGCERNPSKGRASRVRQI